MTGPRDLFDIPAGVTYLNCAYMAPQLAAVTAAGEAALRRKAQPWTIAPKDFFEGPDRLRAAFAALTGLDGEGVALLPAVSYAMATAAANLPLDPGQTIVLLAGEFPSNVYPWRDLAAQAGGEVLTVPRPDDRDWTTALLANIDERAGIVAVPHCHWTDGGLVDLVAVGAAARETGAALAVDATQSLGALPFDAHAIQPDVLVAAGYKWLLGPYSLGLAWYAPWLRSGRPVENSWMTRKGSEDFASLVDYLDEYQPGARRFDVGETSNFALVPMLLAALGQIAEWGIPSIQSTTRQLTDRLAQRAAPLGFRAAPTALRAGHLLGLRAETRFAPDLPDRLAAANIHVSIRGDAIRVSPHLYNNTTDIDRLVDLLAAAV